MSLVTRRGLLLGGGALGLTACATQEFAEAPKDEPRGGIGGTGIVGGLTDFGSLIVAGRRVALPGDAILLDTLGRIDAAGLAVGQVLSLEASTAADGTLIARRVLAAHPIVGRVSAISADRTRFMALGVAVTMEPGAGPAPNVGDRVAVSGVWRGPEVSASRIALAPPGADAVAGAVRIEAGAVRVGGAPLDIGSSSAPTAGAFAIAQGREADGALLVDALEEGRFNGAGGPLARLAVEGYLVPTEAAPFFAVSGLGHSFDANARLAPFASSRTLFEGRYTGDFEVETGLPLPNDVEARRALLRRALNGSLPTGARIGTRPA